MTPLIFPKINVSAALKPVYVEAQAWNQNPSQGDAGGVIVRARPRGRSPRANPTRATAPKVQILNPGKECRSIWKALHNRNRECFVEGAEQSAGLLEEDSPASDFLD